MIKGQIHDFLAAVFFFFAIAHSAQIIRMLFADHAAHEDQKLEVYEEQSTD